MKLTQEYEPQFGIFHDLMKFRVREILLVSSFYDAFVLEEDGRISERIFSEYLDLNLRFVPRITRVSSAEEALAALEKGQYDMVITMMRISDMDVVEFGSRIKQSMPEIPVILLTYEWVEVDLFEKVRKSRSIDKIFYWSGDTRILLAIIKYVEDMKNVERDVKMDVHVILILEDSPKFYSVYLPGIYTEIMTQTRLLITEGVNDLHRLLRMRARPKILMAETYEDGVKLYHRYKKNLLGIISDVEFPRSGKKDDLAGFKFATMVREEIPDLPILIQSANPGNREPALKNRLDFLNKNSETLLQELSQFVLNRFGFGDFVFRTPDGREVGRAGSLHEFQKMIQIIPRESLEFHARRNHISIWLRARTEFETAKKLRPKKVSDFKNIEEVRRFIFTTIQDLIVKNQSGVITDFGPARFDSENSFVRLGEGSMGGKARGIAFLNALLVNDQIAKDFKQVVIRTPHTYVICSEVFEEFIRAHNLQKVAINELGNEKIARMFLKNPLPGKITNDLRTLLQHVRYPIAVRSSSLLEDSQMLPFAGLYSTYMLPNNHSDIEVRLKQLCDAVRLVFASVFFRSPKAYVKNTNFRIEEEKMAVIIQQIVGQKFGDKYYPIISGVAQSYNYYPISHMEPEDGVVQLALGFGYTIVEGAHTHKFSPKYPDMNPPYSSAVEWMKNSQNYFYALNLADPSIKTVKDEKFSLMKLNLSDAEAHGSLFFVASTFSAQENAVKDTISITGPRIITFANVLKYNVFPLTEILEKILRIGRSSFGSHIELEFAVNLFRKKEKRPEFHLLQIRPLVGGREHTDVSLDKVDEKQIICMSHHVMGNGIFDEISDLVYIDPDAFDIGRSRLMAREVEEINQRFIEEDRYYILIGFGRWGTADPWLGIPVEWFQISRARVIIESDLNQFVVEPSQGSHFFHNLVSLRMGYFHIKPRDNTECINWTWIKKQKHHDRKQFIRHIRFPHPLVVKIDGRLKKGAVFKP
jgi:CheY-like chemotaxis protein